MVIRVAVWGTGMMGQGLLGFLLDRPKDVEIVGVIAHDPRKEGRSVGELLGRPCDVAMTTDFAAVLAKKPDAKWKREFLDVVSLVTIQEAILENAASLVKPGGVLVYCTCTIEPEENYDLIKRFIARHSEFSIEPATPFVPDAVVTSEGTIETFPHRHGMDGSFAIRLRKSS